MSLTKCIGVFSVVILSGSMAVVGCSSSDSGPAATPDAGSDAKTTRPDTGSPVPVDDGGASGDTGGPTECKPDDEKNFVPTWHGPNAKSSACDQATVTAYHKCLTDSQTATSTPASCAPFQQGTITAEAKACLLCIGVGSSDTAKTYGPTVDHGGVTELNIAGCIALATGDTSSTGCAAKYQAASQCPYTACAANCPVSDNASFKAEQDCEKIAQNGDCAKWEDTSCLDGLADAGSNALEVCGLTDQNATFDSVWDKIVPLFCVGGGAPSDAGGTDSAAPADAATD